MIDMNFSVSLFDNFPRGTVVKFMKGLRRSQFLLTVYELSGILLNT